MTILILAALPEEADAFLPGHGVDIADHWPPSRRIDCSRQALIIATTGIGKVNIAAAAGALHARYGGSLMLVIGTAGKLSEAQGDCFWVEKAVQHDYGAARDNGFIHYEPGAWPMGPALFSPYEAIKNPGLPLPHATIVSGDAFIEDADKARHLIDALSGDLVDMETAAVAQFATHLGLPWAAIKAPTDDANHASARDFQTNLAAAARRAAQAAEQFVNML